MASKAPFILLIVIIGVSVVMFFATLPSSAVGGSSQTICTLSLSASGLYNDYFIDHWISSFGFEGGVSGCQPQTLLGSMIPPYQLRGNSLNLGQVQVTFTVTITTSDGVAHGPFTLTATIPPLNTAYAFTATSTVGNFPLCSCQASVNVVSSVHFSDGSSSYTTKISV